MGCSLCAAKIEKSNTRKTTRDSAVQSIATLVVVVEVVLVYIGSSLVATDKVSTLAFIWGPGGCRILSKSLLLYSYIATAANSLLELSNRGPAVIHVLILPRFLLDVAFVFLRWQALQLLLLLWQQQVFNCDKCT